MLLLDLWISCERISTIYRLGLAKSQTLSEYFRKSEQLIRNIMPGFMNKTVAWSKLYFLEGILRMPPRRYRTKPGRLHLGWSQFKFQQRNKEREDYINRRQHRKKITCSEATKELCSLKPLSSAFNALVFKVADYPLKGINAEMETKKDFKAADRS